MLSFFLKIIGFFMNLWGGLSDEQKEKIIDLIIEGFEAVFRRFYQEKTKEA
ncbi:hypothetical protein SAMN04487787_110136 [Kosakonia sacchari]|nr:hypothetical protein SAMN04487787_110136 [Kosakonia sacchari]